MTVRDLILGGEAVRVEEKLGSEGAAPWDRLAARVVAVNGKNRFTGAVLRFRHELSQQLLSAFEKMAGEMHRDIRSDARDRRETAPVTRAVAREIMVRTPLFARILSQFWMFDAVVQARAPAPELRNTDDEAMVFCEVRFPLEGDKARVAAVLDGIEEFEREEDGVARWRWFAAGSPLQRAARHRRGGPVAESSQNAIGTTSLGYAETRKRTLVLSVNSRERAGRGRDLLASRLGGLVGPALIAQQAPERALEEQAGQAPDEPAIPPEEPVQAIHSYLDEHYRRTLDDPLPMLDGKSLRQAAATRKGRGRVIDWLKQLENTEQRSAAGSPALRHRVVVARAGDRGAALARGARHALARYAARRASMRAVPGCGSRCSPASTGSANHGAEEQREDGIKHGRSPGRRARHRPTPSGAGARASSRRRPAARRITTKEREYWHGYPEAWDKMDAKLKRQWLLDGLVSCRELRTYRTRRQVRDAFGGRLVGRG